MTYIGWIVLSSLFYREKMKTEKSQVTYPRLVSEAIIQKSTFDSKFNVIFCKSYLSIFALGIYDTRTSFCTKSIAAAKSTHIAQHSVQSNILGFSKEC